MTQRSEILRKIFCVRSNVFSGLIGGTTFVCARNKHYI